MNDERHAEGQSARTRPDQAQEQSAELFGPARRIPEGAPMADGPLQDERLLEATIEDSFPASDPPSQTPVTGSSQSEPNEVREERRST